MTPSQRIIPPDRARHALHTLLFGTTVCAGMLVGRLIYAGNHRFSYLFWNLFLAWIPFVLALFIRRMPADGNRLLFWSAMIVWILFYPNAFYIVTDLIHYNRFGTDGVSRWFDLIMAVSFACGGMFLGCLSLYLLHLFVRERFGWRTGWLFAGTMLALGSFGIYLGRALRLNSWDAFTRPHKLAGVVYGLAEPGNLAEVAGFSVMFFFFSLVVYSFMVSVARLHESEPPVAL